MKFLSLLFVVVCFTSLLFTVNAQWEEPDFDIMSVEELEEPSSEFEVNGIHGGPGFGGFGYGKYGGGFGGFGGFGYNKGAGYAAAIPIAPPVIPIPVVNLVPSSPFYGAGKGGFGGFNFGATKGFNAGFGFGGKPGFGGFGGHH